MHRYRRPTAVTAGCLALGACEYSQTSNCWETTGTTTTPDWVFALFVAAGLVALMAGVSWAAFLFEPAPQPVSRSQRAIQVVHLAASTVCLTTVVVSIARSPESWFTSDGLVFSAVLALCLVPMAALVAGVRQYRRTGRWPLRREAPWGMFWVLPVLGLAAAVTSVGALVAMIASIQVTSSGPC